MKCRFHAVIWQEESWFIAQCLEVDVVSQGESEEEALANLKEALELYFEHPPPTLAAKMAQVEVEVGAA